MNIELTARQTRGLIKIDPASIRGKILLAIEDVMQIDGRHARYADIAASMNYKSYGTISTWIADLERRGYVKRPGKGYSGGPGIRLCEPAKDWLARHGAPQTQREAV